LEKDLIFSHWRQANTTVAAKGIAAFASFSMIRIATVSVGLHFKLFATIWAVLNADHHSCVIHVFTNKGFNHCKLHFLFRVKKIKNLVNPIIFEKMI
jgi:hypothetical protein